jgi:TolA-binding protein
MTIKNISIGVLYLLLLGLFGYNEISDAKYQDQQFKKINKLNNDLIEISRYVEKNLTDFEYLERNINDNSQEINELKLQVIEHQNTAESFYNMFFDTQSQRLSKEEPSLGAETTPPIDNPKAGADVTSEVSAPSVSTSPYVEEREQEVVTAPKMDSPVPNKVIASCPRPRNNLGKYIANINLRRDYSFVAEYDVLNGEIVNLSFNRNLPGKLQRAIEKYLNSFLLTQDKEGCKLPIKLLKG